MSRTLFLVAMALLALLSIGVASAADGQPTAITKEAADMHRLYLFVLIMGGIVLVGVEAAIIWAVIRYRKKNDELPVQTHGSTIIEMLWTGIPVAIVIALFTYSFIVLRDVEHPHTASDLTVGVEGFQFQWAFTYNGNDLGTHTDPNSKAKVTITGTAAKEPTLVLPVGEPVEFTLHSNDVIHSFYVRNFLYKLDVIPGRNNRFSVTPTKTGEYIGQCAELCGLDHSIMRFKVQVVDRATFDKWFADQVAGTQAAVQQPQ